MGLETHCSDGSAQCWVAEKLQPHLQMKLWRGLWPSALCIGTFYYREAVKPGCCQNHTGSREWLLHVALPKISKNLNITRELLALRTYVTRCFFLYLSSKTVQSGIFISAHVSKFWLFSFPCCMCVCEYRNGRCSEAKNLQQIFLQTQQNCSWDPPNAKGGLWWANITPSKNIWVV